MAARRCRVWRWDAAVKPILNLRNCGLELADSITIDPHKWFYAPLDAGAVLVKNEKRLTASFGMKPSYLTDEMDQTGERDQYYVHGFEQSRRFRSLKVWMNFQALWRTNQIGEWIDNNVRQARHSICASCCGILSLRRPAIPQCLRFAFDTSGRDLDENQSETAARAGGGKRVEQSGQFWISTTELKGKAWFRINPVNFRTREEHMDRLFALLQEQCRAAIEEMH